MAFEYLENCKQLVNYSTSIRNFILFLKIRKCLGSSSWRRWRPILQQHSPLQRDNSRSQDCLRHESQLGPVHHQPWKISRIFWKHRRSCCHFQTFRLFLNLCFWLDFIGRRWNCFPLFLLTVCFLDIKQISMEFELNTPFLGSDFKVLKCK